MGTKLKGPYLNDEDEAWPSAFHEESLEPWNPWKLTSIQSPRQGEVTALTWQYAQKERKKKETVGYANPVF